MGFNIQDFHFPHSALGNKERQSAGVKYLYFSGVSGARAALSIHLATVSPSPAILTHSKSAAWEAVSLVHYQYKHSHIREVYSHAHKVVSLSVCTALKL